MSILNFFKTNKSGVKKSKSGSDLYEYQKGKDFSFAGIEDLSAREKIEDHIEKHIGKIDNVYHELVSHLVHLDIYIVKATKERPYHTLITSGMSDLKMNLPKEAKQAGCSEYLELMAFLPKEWTLDSKILADAESDWPLFNLKTIARMPHEYDSFLGFGHTVQNSNPIEPFASDTELCASLLLPPVMLPKEAWELKVNKNKTIEFYNVMPIYLEELQFKLEEGLNPLLDKFDKYGITDIVDISRRNTCK